MRELLGSHLCKHPCYGGIHLFPLLVSKHLLLTRVHSSPVSQQGYR